MHATTAVRWANLAAADWERYVAARADDRQR